MPREHLQRRKTYSGERFIEDSRIFDNFTKKSSANFEFTLNLIGPREHTDFIKLYFKCI